MALKRACSVCNLFRPYMPETLCCFRNLSHCFSVGRGQSSTGNVRKESQNKCLLLVFFASVGYCVVHVPVSRDKLHMAKCMLQLPPKNKTSIKKYQLGYLRLNSSASDILLGKLAAPSQKLSALLSRLFTLGNSLGKKKPIKESQILK